MDINLSKNPNFGLPPQMKSSRNSLFEVVLLIIVCALFAWFLLLPKQKALDAKKAELSATLEEQGQVADKRAKLQELVDKLEAHPEEVEKLDDALPLDGKVVNLHLLIEALARQVNVEVADISLSGKTGVVAGDKALLSNFYGSSRVLQKITGSLRVSGSFSQLEAFLRKIEESGRLMDVTDLSISPGDEGLLSMNLTLNAYYFAP